MKLISGQINDNNYHHFGEVLNKVYGAESPLKSLVHKINPRLAEKYFVVLKDEVPVARLIKYTNPSLTYNGSTPALFGNFESINDKEVVKLLFSEFGNIALIGPICGNTWNDYRIALPTKTKAPFFTEFVNQPYYKELLSAVGFEKLASYKSSHALSYDINEKKLNQCIELFGNRGITVRELNMNEFEKDLKHIYDVSIEGFKNNFLYAPISEQEFFEKYLPLKAIAHPSTILLAFEAEKCVAFSMCLPNLYNKEVNQLVMKSAARLPGFKYNGIGTYFNELLKIAAKKEGYQELIVAFLIDYSVSERTFSDANNSEVYREYEILIRK